MKYPKHGYIFGRVILVDLPERHGPLPGCNLIYIYRGNAETTAAGDRVFSRDDLLVPPAFINRLPWSRGFFETTDHRMLTAEDIIEQHCFHHTVFGKTNYYDIGGRQLDGPFAPCGIWGLHSYLSLDDEISDALHIARVPDWTE